MENYQGDLGDIVRASGTATGGSTDEQFSGWQFPVLPENASSEPNDDFGDPFSSMTDPLLHELVDIPASCFFNSQNSMDLVKPTMEEFTGDSSSTSTNVFSRMLQISPNTKFQCDSQAIVSGAQRGLKTSPSSASSAPLVNSSKSCLVESSGLQISSPRNPGIKRRKSQAKKVISVPAPAASNSRPSGEVVPSDLWAWRKYGQKPIKGSPYPRGYYRCSSSKGCSARKQVERSRTDPNMLVITYTSEHNHPWPTQRNALAGSTRSQPSKNNASSKSSCPSSQTQKSATPKEEQRDSNNNDGVVKEEMEEVEKKEEDMDDDNDFSEGLPQSYRPTMPETNQSEDFFADLVELEGDPLNLIFTQGFTGDEERDNKTLDPFSLFDWTGSNNSNTSFGEAAKRDL